MGKKPVIYRAREREETEIFFIVISSSSSSSISTITRPSGLF
jgi:hypothetical protein